MRFPFSSVVESVLRYTQTTKAVTSVVNMGVCLPPNEQEALAHAWSTKWDDRLSYFLFVPIFTRCLLLSRNRHQVTWLLYSNSRLLSLFTSDKDVQSRRHFAPRRPIEYQMLTIPIAYLLLKQSEGNNRGKRHIHNGNKAIVTTSNYYICF